MALANYQEAQTYLKFLPLLQDLPKQPFFIVYDPEADVYSPELEIGLL